MDGLGFGRAGSGPVVGLPLQGLVAGGEWRIRDTTAGLEGDR